MPAKKAPHVGDRVKWKTSQGETAGKVLRKATKPLKIKGFKLNASKDDPRYVVKSEKSGHKAAHKASSLRKA